MHGQSSILEGMLVARRAEDRRELGWGTGRNDGKEAVTED